MHPPVYLNEKISIGIAAHGNTAITTRCLEALFMSVRGEFELILIDDASPDETLKVFRDVPAIHNRTQIYSFDRNLEYSNSVNAILSHASGEYIFFLSNDILTSPSYFSELLDTAKNNKIFGVLRGCSNFVDNGLTSHNIPCIVEPENIESLFDFAECRQSVFGSEIEDDRFLTGDAFMVTRRLLDSIGTYDTDFIGYFSDHDFGIRAKRHGFRTVLARGAFCWHYCGTNFNYLPNNEKEVKAQLRTTRIQEASAHFFRKYGLDTSTTYQGIAALPWEMLSSQHFEYSRDFCPPLDYGIYRVV